MGCLKLTYYESDSFQKVAPSDLKISVKGCAGGYRYGFGGQEMDNEVSGKGNSYTAEFWQYSPRLGQRWNIDPMTAKYPWQSPYSTFNNNPLRFTDKLGLEGQDWIGKKDEKGGTNWTWDKNVKSKDQLPSGYTEFAKPGHTYSSGGENVKLGDNGKWNYTGKNANGNYINQQGMDIQGSGQDEANTNFKMKMDGLSEGLDKIKLGFGATLVAPFVGAALTTTGAFGVSSSLSWKAFAAKSAISIVVQGVVNDGKINLVGVVADGTLGFGASALVGSGVNAEYNLNINNLRLNTLGNGISGNQFLFNSSVGMVFGGKSDFLGKQVGKAGVNSTMTEIISSPVYQFSSNGLSKAYEEK